MLEFWLYLQNGIVNFYHFIAQNIFFIFEKTLTLQKLKFLKNLDFFHEIQNLSKQRPIFLGPQSSASSSDFFGQVSNLVIILEFFFLN